MFVWESVGNVTTNWHNRGGLMVIARDINHARELIAQEVPDETFRKKDGDCEALTKDPDMVYLVSNLLDWEVPEARVVVFPDSGCC